LNQPGRCAKIKSQPAAVVTPGVGVTDDTDKTGRGLSKVYRWLSAPLLITIVGAVLAGYLIPRINSQAEDHRRAREIQTSLVQDMSEAVAGVIPTGRLIATRTIKKAGANPTAIFNDALLEWETSRTSIEARLRAYFENASVEGQSLPQAWLAYSEAVERLYYLSTTEFRSRCSTTRNLMRYLSPRHPPPSCPKGSWTGDQLGTACARASDPWDALSICDEDSLKASGEGYVRGQNYFNAYGTISTALLRRQYALLDAVRTTTPAGF
jgi:hypothetical protein